MEYEQILLSTGGFGRLQFSMLFIFGILCFKAIAELQVLVLSLNEPLYRCKQQNASGFEPQSFAKHCSINMLINDTSMHNVSEPCDGFEYIGTFVSKTLIEEYNLVCDRKWLGTLMTSMYFLGVSVGVLLTTLGDKVGRKRVFYAAGAMDLLSTLLPAFMPEIYSQIFTRFLKGIPTPVYSQGLLLLQEFTMEQHRGRVANCYWIFWSSGFMSSGLIAYLLQDWQKMQLFSLIFCISYPLIYIIVPESARWLVLKGRNEEAISVLKYVAKCNGANWTPSSELQEIRTEPQPTGRMSELFTYKQMRTKTSIIFLMMLVQSFCYFGISINTSFITNDIFVSTAISGALEAPSYVLAAALCEIIGRRVPTIAMNAISGICIVCVAFLSTFANWPYVHMAVAIVGKTLLTASYSLMGVLSTELFPTSVRTTGMYLAFLLGSLINVLSPVILFLSEVTPYLPGLLFGGIAAISSASVYFLPETKGLPLPEDVPSSETLVRGNEQRWAMEQQKQLAGVAASPSESAANAALMVAADESRAHLQV